MTLINPRDNIDYAFDCFCREPFSPTTEEAIAALERRINVSFPDDFRSYLLRYNGGFFNEPSIVEVDGRFPDDSLVSMYGISASHPCAELGQESELRLWDGNDPPILFPIGYTSLGFIILLITEIAAEDFGCIYLRTFGSPILKTENESHYLAEDMDEFFSLLEAGEDE